ncbi:hypothetical protein HU200_024830 [Digitaria exilis]|uniref:non-specific serine/threonine protein kinase n=1 Tax=Digitaria exilis TaxID=1010633 RepID=A0A835C3W2_9POAL|nr:hypothetical protein HU200_024830 [Digitaria exilis]
MAAARLLPPLALLLLLSFLLAPPLTTAATATPSDTLHRKSSLTVDEHDTRILRSHDGTFSCGFYPIYDGAFTFSIWYTDDTEATVVWSANRGNPVHAWGAAVTLRKDGNMVLTDYDGTVVWQTNSQGKSIPDVQYAQLLDTGNLVLKNSSGDIVWQSFDSATDTFLPTQLITETSKLVSTTQLYVPGHYTFRFSDQSMLSLIYDDTNVTSVYWPDPDFQYYENGRNFYNSTRIASLGDSGEIFSSDIANNHVFVASDRGTGVKRRLKLDYDGNLRLYSLNNSDKTWSVSWIAEFQPCKTHGLCGPYGICHYSPRATCSCPPGYQMKNPANWTQGCIPIVDISCDGEQNMTFLELPNTDYWGSDQQRIEKVPWETCRNACLSDCSCKGFQYQVGNGTCYPKSLLFNGRSFPNPTVRTMYIKLPSSLDTSKLPIPQSNVLNSVQHRLQCDHVSTTPTTEQNPSYWHKISVDQSKWFYFYGFIGAFFVIEVFFFAFAWFFVLRREMRSSQVWAAEEGYKMMTDHFRMYSYKELDKATEKFAHELGWGGTGVAYKGILDDDRMVVVKKLGNIRHSREEFHDELHVIARIYHMNLVRIYGFCSERSHRILEREEPFWIAEIVDFRLGGEFDHLQAKALIKLAISCLEEERKKRPTMESVVESLLSVDLAANH